MLEAMSVACVLSFAKAFCLSLSWFQMAWTSNAWLFQKWTIQKLDFSGFQIPTVFEINFFQYTFWMQLTSEYQIDISVI